MARDLEATVTAAATPAQKTDAAATPPTPPVAKATPATVTLENRTGRRLVFHLSHATCTEASCTCKRVAVGVHDHHPKSGAKTLRAFVRRLPDSITLNARRSEGYQVSGLPMAIINDPHVAKALKKKRIAFVKDEPEVAAHDRKVADKIAAQKRAVATVKADDAKVEKAKAADAAAKAAELEAAKKASAGPQASSGSTGPAKGGKSEGDPPKTPGAGDNKAGG
jgi:hypothetical protein